jgi:protein arginine kinase
MRMSLNELANSRGEWLATGGPMHDVVISSRVRLARNLADHRFLSRADEPERNEIGRTLSEAVSACDFSPKTFYVELDKLTPLDRQLLVERHLISRQHAEGEGNRSAAIARNETFALMINEEDHLRIQVLRRGMNLETAWNEIVGIDNALETVIRYAYHPKYGYLTACPTNVGTGMRISVMLHLPALKMTGELEKVFRAAKDMQLAVRGLYGEGTDALGDFFQLSNQTTLGRSEEQILSEFTEKTIPAIVKYEQHARSILQAEKSQALDDRVFRAWGLLENARMIATDEALYMLSQVRLGVMLDRLTQVNLDTVNDLFLFIQAAHLQKRKGANLDSEERSYARAELIRQKLHGQNPKNN